MEKLIAAYLASLKAMETILSSMAGTPESDEFVWDIEVWVSSEMYAKLLANKEIHRLHDVVGELSFTLGRLGFIIRERNIHVNDNDQE